MCLTCVKWRRSRCTRNGDIFITSVHQYIGSNTSRVAECDEFGSDARHQLHVQKRTSAAKMLFLAGTQRTGRLPQSVKLRDVPAGALSLTIASRVVMYVVLSLPRIQPASIGPILCRNSLTMARKRRCLCNSFSISSFHHTTPWHHRPTPRHSPEQ